jgi:hypothetical protein
MALFSACFNLRINTSTLPQGDRRERVSGRGLACHQPEPACDRRHDQCGLDHRKAMGDADAWSAAEGQARKAR